MKTISAITVMLTLTILASTIASAADSTQTQDQMQTLIPTDNYTSGGFGGPVIKVGPVDA